MIVEKEERPPPPERLKKIAMAKIEDLEGGKIDIGEEEK